MVCSLEKEPQDLVLVSPMNWAILSVFGVLFLTIIFYASFSFIPIQVEGVGLVFNPNHTVAISSPSSEEIRRVIAYGGERVEKGSPLIEWDASKEILRSQIEGTIFEVEVSSGSFVKKGEPLMWVQKPLSRNKGLQVGGLISNASGQKIRLGMSVEIDLVHTQRLEHGRLKGVVSSLIPLWTPSERTRFPIRRLAATLEEDQFPMLIVIDLLQNPRDPTQYVWTSKKMNHLPVHLGAPCKFIVTVEKKRLISSLFNF